MLTPLLNLIGQKHRKSSKRLAETGSAAPVRQVVTAGSTAQVPYSDLGYQVFITTPDVNIEKREIKTDNISLSEEDKFDGKILTC